MQENILYDRVLACFPQYGGKLHEIRPGAGYVDDFHVMTASNNWANFVA